MTLTLENTAIVLDSTADFPEAQVRFPNMCVVPLYVRFGEESFRDYVELDPHGFYARLRTASELPTTSQPTPQDFISTYHALSGYERIYSLHISSKLSGTFQSASLAAGEIGGDRIRLVEGSADALPFGDAEFAGLTGGTPGTPLTPTVSIGSWAFDARSPSSDRRPVAGRRRRLRGRT